MIVLKRLLTSLIRFLRSFWFKVQMRADDDMRDEILGRVSYYLSQIDRSIPRSHAFVLSDRSVLHIQSDSRGVHLTRSIKGGVNDGLYDTLLRQARENPAILRR